MGCGSGAPCPGPLWGASGLPQSVAVSWGIDHGKVAGFFHSECSKEL